MHRIIGYILLMLSGIFTGQALIAQPVPRLFQPLTWEEAGLIAARENKLVLVEAGPVENHLEEKLQKHRELTNLLMRNVVAIRMDMSSPMGQEFEPRLLLYPHPVYVYFMPYGDLVGVLDAAEAGQNPERLREVLQEAQRVAEEKKKNSRAVEFTDLNLPDALQAAGEAGKNVFVYIFESDSQPSLLMDKNIFNLDRVADFYNRNFVCLRFPLEDLPAAIRSFGTKAGPEFLFLNAEGKVLYRASGYSEATLLLEYGNKALEKAKGIPFDTLTDGQARQQARQRGKLVFTNYYTPGAAYKEMTRTIFADPEVTDFCIQHFINVGREGNPPVMIFSDAAGNELHRVVHVNDAAELLDELRRVLAGEGIAGMRQCYLQGERDTVFLERYIRMLVRAGLKEEASRMNMEYFSLLSPEYLKKPAYWDFFYQYGDRMPPVYFDYLLVHREELYRLYGEEKVRKKITELGISGVWDFIHETGFDESGFKLYTKKLKKEKVEGWRTIIRDARMLAAEKLEDWKTFIVLAEEKWTEEQVSDAELYQWGVMVFGCCPDEGVRYKTAQWLAERVMEMEKQERITGKIKISSYKGFFEKLVNDLLKK